MLDVVVEGCHRNPAMVIDLPGGLEGKLWDETLFQQVVFQLSLMSHCGFGLQAISRADIGMVEFLAAVRDMSSERCSTYSVMSHDGDHGHQAEEPFGGAP